MSAANPYVIVACRAMGKTVAGVRALMADGYVPCGGPIVVPMPIDDEDLGAMADHICQAMIWPQGSGDRKPEQPGVPADGWIQVTQRMPEDTSGGVATLLLWDGQRVICGGWADPGQGIEGEGWYENDYGHVHGITHWRPLPAPPSGAEAQP